MLNIKYMVLDHALLDSYPTTDSNTSTGMIWATLNMPSATEECREQSGKCQGTSHCLESGQPEHFPADERSYFTLIPVSA